MIQEEMECITMKAAFKMLENVIVDILEKSLKEIGDDKMTAMNKKYIIEDIKRSLNIWRFRNDY